MFVIYIETQPLTHFRLNKLPHTIQYNVNGSNPDGSFTVDDSNSFFSPYKSFQ